MSSKQFRRASLSNIKSIHSFLRKEGKRFQEQYDKKGDSHKTLNDFLRITTLGAGTYGRVVLVKEKASNHYYAMKILDKAKILKMDQIEHTLNEKKILQALNHPFLVHMEYFFQDNSYLYFVLPFIEGGEMFGLLKHMRMFTEDHARFYAAQVCLALEYLHSLKLVYRDLKPENILIDIEGYIKITDFGFCKLINGRTYTLCGTPEYLAPEIVLSRGYSHAVDWWSYGVLIFEMNAGFPPFRDSDLLVLYDKIAAGKYKNPLQFSISLRDLLKNILQTDLTKRYGNLTKGANDIKDHRWFNTIDWLTLLNKKMSAPYLPRVEGPEDTSNFENYVDEEIRVSETNQYEKFFSQF